MFKSLLHGLFPPTEVNRPLLSGMPPELFCIFNQCLGGILMPVEQDVLHPDEQLLWNLLIDLKHSGIHDSHIHAGLNRMIEKCRVHGLTHDIVTAKTKGYV